MSKFFDILKKKLMGVDSSQHDMANVYDFAEFSDNKGLEESVQRLFYRCINIFLKLKK